MLAFSTGVSASPPETSIVIRDTCSVVVCLEGGVALVCAFAGKCATQSANAATHIAADARNLISVNTPSSTQRAAWSSLSATIFDANSGSRAAHACPPPYQPLETLCGPEFDCQVLLRYLLFRFHPAAWRPLTSDRITCGS